MVLSLEATLIIDCLRKDAITIRIWAAVAFFILLFFVFLMHHFSAFNLVLSCSKSVFRSCLSRVNITYPICIFGEVHTAVTEPELLRWLCDGSSSPEHEHEKGGNCSKS